MVHDLSFRESFTKCRSWAFRGLTRILVLPQSFVLYSETIVALVRMYTAQMLVQILFAGETLSRDSLTIWVGTINIRVSYKREPIRGVLRSFAWKSGRNSLVIVDFEEPS